jgi:hypothetical protein
VAEWWADDVLACRWVDKEMEFNVRQSVGDSLWEPLLAREHLSHDNLAYHSGKKSYVRSVGDPSMRLAVVDVTVVLARRLMMRSRCDCSSVNQHGDVIFDIIDCEAAGRVRLRSCRTRFGARKLVKSFNTGELVTSNPTTHP